MQTSVLTSRPNQRHLWSTLEEVRTLLRLPKIDESTTIELFSRRKVKPCESVYRMGQQFEYIFIVSSGFLKNIIIDEEGTEQILGFPMRGDLLGFDGINEDRHHSEAIALTDVEVIAISLSKLSDFAFDQPELSNWVYRAISRELVREQTTVGMLGMLGAEARVARFLYALGQRYFAMGFSSQNFILRMTRKEIGCYLGLTVETVSRSISALISAGFIRVRQKEVEIICAESLRTLHRIDHSVTIN
jgi:CRP/FNR family transcriptional regulator, anaerobic regulatory protein